MTDPQAGPSKAATGIAATLPLLFAAVSCCVLPMAATGDPDRMAQFVQEMGVWFYVVAGVGALSAVVCAVLMGLAARGKRIPAVITLFFAGLPWLAGLAGTTASIGVATAAVEYADPSSRAMMMAQGVAEASSAKLMGAWLSGALLSATGLGWAFAALGQKAPGRRGIGALLAVAASLPVLGLVGFAYLGAGPNALVLALPGLSLLVGAGMAAAGAGEDAPRHRSGAMAAAAPVALGLAFVATTVAVHTGAIIEIFGALAMAGDGKMDILAAAAGDLAPVTLVATWGGVVMLLPVAAVGIWAATRGKLSAGRVVGAVLLLLVAASLPAADVLVNARTGDALANASVAPWDGVEGFTPIALVRTDDHGSPDALLLADGRIQRIGGAPTGDRAGLLGELAGQQGAPAGGDPLAGLRAIGDPTTVSLAIDRTTDAATLRAVLGELRQADATVLRVTGTGEASLDASQRETIRRNAPMLALIGDPLLSVAVSLRPAPDGHALVEGEVYTATVGAEPPGELRRLGLEAPPLPLTEDTAHGERRGFGEPRRTALIAIGDDADAGSVFRTASLAAAHGLEPILVATEPEAATLAGTLGEAPPEGVLAMLGGTEGAENTGLADALAALEDRPSSFGRTGRSGDNEGRADTPAGRGTGGSASAGDPTVRGSLSRDVIQRVIRRHTSAVRYCYERVLARDPTLAGTVTLRIVIAPTGVVSEAAVQQSSLGSDTVEACLTRQARRWRFPAPNGGGIVIVNYPFVFRSS